MNPTIHRGRKPGTYSAHGAAIRRLLPGAETAPIECSNPLMQRSLRSLASLIGKQEGWMLSVTFDRATYTATVRRIR